MLIISLLFGCTFQKENEEVASPRTTPPLNQETKIVALGVRGDVPVSLWSNGSLKEGMKKREIQKLESPILIAAFSRDGNFIGGATDKELFVISLDGSINKKFLAPKTRLSSAAFDAETQSLLLAGVDSRVYRWKFTEEDTIKKPSFERYAGHGSVVSAICADVASPVFFSSDWVGVLSAWLPYDADRFLGKFDANIFGSTVFQDNDKVRVNAERNADTSPFDWLVTAEGFLFAASQDGNIEQWQIRGFKKRAKVQGHSSSLVAFVADKNAFLVSAGRDGTVKTWNGATSGQITLLSEHQFASVDHLAVGEKKIFVSLKNGSIEDFEKSPA